ncbi:hypothetical protein COOONC_02145 [Cooperia oncophora]
MGNMPLTQSKAAPRLYSYAPDKMPDTPGFYTIAVKIQSQRTCKTPSEFTVEDLKLGALEKDDVVSGANLASVALFSKHGKVITADHTKRLYISFSVKSKVSGNLVQPHQNLAKAHKDFEGVSGKYTAYLIVATIKTPLNWAFADFMLTLPSAHPEVVPKSQRITYDVLPEIKHVFRQPEKRPPTIVSDALTLICLAPLLLLFVLWFRIGLNFGNMPVSLWTLIFHGSLAALFALYFVFWLQLNMLRQ